MTTTLRSSTTTVIDRFITGVEAGHVTAELYTDDAVVDATVPGWRFSAEGPAAIERLYAGWFDFPCTFDELERQPFPGGEVVRYLHSFVTPDGVRAAHHQHVLCVEDDRIVRDTVFCGGRWPEPLLAEMGLTVHAG